MSMTRDEALEALRPYRGRKGRFREELGDHGILMAHLAFDGSPTNAAEFFGYASKSQMTRDFARMGLAVHKRDASDPTAGWRRFDNEPTVEELRARLRNATSGVEHALEVSWTVPRGTEFARLICVADLHYGEHAQDYARWEALRDWIAANPDVRWLFHGDLYDLACTTSPGRSMTRQVLSFEEARRVAEADLRPIAAQCIALCTGNHDLRVARGLQIDFDPVRDMAERLGVPHLGYEGFVRYQVTDGKHTQSYVGYHHHGFGGGQTWGAFFNKLQRLADRNSADFVVMGHAHQLAAVTTTKRQVSVEGQVQVIDCPIVGAGSFLKHEGGSYAAEDGLAPSVLGAATMYLYLSRHSVHARA